jgi:hypothetical protein
MNKSLTLFGAQCPEPTVPGGPVYSQAPLISDPTTRRAVRLGGSPNKSPKPSLSLGSHMQGRTALPCASPVRGNVVCLFTEFSHERGSGYVLGAAHALEVIHGVPASEVGYRSGQL